MTNQSVQKLLMFLLFFWSCTLVWATTAPPRDQIHVGAETIIKGLDNIYVVNEPAETQPIEAVSGASVYILPNTVFEKSSEAEVHATLVRVQKTEKDRNKLHTFTAPQKGITATEEPHFEQYTALPFEQVPTSRNHRFIHLATVLVTLPKSDVHKNTKSLGLVIADFVHVQANNNTSPFSEPVLVLFSTHGKAYYATRPPPVC